MKYERKQRSLRTQLIVMIVLCWVLPIILVASGGIFLLNRSYERSAQQKLELAGEFAVEQMASHFNTILFESKTVSYDGVVRNAYRLFTVDGDRAALYRTVNGYLKQHFARREPVDAVFMSFWEIPGLMPYITNQGEDSDRAVLAGYTETEPIILADMADVDTAIRLYARNDTLYMARNLLDSRMKPYATVVLSCSLSYLTAPLASLDLTGPAWGRINDIAFSPEGTFLTAVPSVTPFSFSRTVDQHVITLFAVPRSFDLFNDLDELPVLLGIVSVLVLFLLFSILYMFEKQVSRPVHTLVEANRLVENGERGYQITKRARSQEFDSLYSHFNSMSGELQKQFQLVLEEQQALHQARIKALHSQINPHFLNNTLEIINWESRIAGNDQITKMIEALSTMLNTSLNRDDNPQIVFDDEMHYTEAYVYIITQRMGDKLHVEYDIDPSLQGISVPRMILQPLVENAVEHDLNRSSGGKMLICAKRMEGTLLLYVEHNGHILPEDREKLDRLLQPDTTEAGDRVHIGVRNVNQRLRLLYGSAASLTINEIDDGTVRAEIRLPIS